MNKNQITGGIVGLVVADALGVPVEFRSRDELKADPVTGMRGYGTYNQPAGTWSDDSSMTLATIKSLILCDGFNKDNLRSCFCDWLYHGKYTPHGDTFDVGNTTRAALINGHGMAGEHANGNGALMRILPFAMYDCKAEDIEAAAAITHAHDRSLLACLLYCDIVREISKNAPLDSAIYAATAKYPYQNEWKHFDRLPYLADYTEDEIRSSGYVVDTLEAALWCALTTDNYRDCVLKAVNLGEDTDTVAAVAGGLAGVIYGFDGIPGEWVDAMQQKDYVCGLAQQFADWVIR